MQQLYCKTTDRTEGLKSPEHVTDVTLIRNHKNELINELELRHKTKPNRTALTKKKYFKFIL